MERSTKPAPSSRESAHSSAAAGRRTSPRQSVRTLAAEPERRVARAASLTQAARQAAVVLTADERRLAAQTLAHLAQDAEAGAADALESWLGPAPSDPVALELRSLRQRFQLRRQVLSRTLSADEVAELLQTRSRQTAHDRAKAGTLLAIRDNGRLRFPLCQFDPEGPDGVAPGLAVVLQALHLPALAKAAWLERPHPA
ncbi:MAG: hypothetical protein RLZZ216_2422, partial [Cyanobacteriota bacterium]